MSEIPPQQLQVAPTQFRTFCVAVACGVSQDQKIFVMTGQTPDGGTASLEFPFESIDDIIKAMRQSQGAAAKLVVPDMKIPTGPLNGNG